jgi:hypothetical protein
MKNLSRALALKIGITVFFWFIPLLFFPIDFLNDSIGFPELGPPVFIRLLGMAYGALLVGYVFGLIESLDGRYPRQAVWAGIVSNGGAFLLLSMAAFRHVWDTWDGWAPAFMWGSLGATGLISAGLIAFGPCGRHRTSRSTSVE